ncbi:MAG: hypothetical protein AAGA66_07380, partial [Bacteroidota bacterium]
MARSKILKLTFIFLIFIYRVSAQESDRLIYNFNQPVVELGPELRGIDAPECYANLLSISNLELNYPAKLNVPSRLYDFLVDNGIIQESTNSKDYERDVFLLGRYIHSVNYDSYLIIATEEYLDIGGDDTKYLYLVNIKSDTLISV